MGGAGIVFIKTEREKNEKRIRKERDNTKQNKAHDASQKEHSLSPNVANFSKKKFFCVWVLFYVLGFLGARANNFLSDSFGAYAGISDARVILPCAGCGTRGGSNMSNAAFLRNNASRFCSTVFSARGSSAQSTSRE